MLLLQPHPGSYPCRWRPGHSQLALCQLRSGTPAPDSASLVTRTGLSTLQRCANPTRAPKLGQRQCGHTRVPVTPLALRQPRSSATARTAAVWTHTRQPCHTETPQPRCTPAVVAADPCSTAGCSMPCSLGAQALPHCARTTNSCTRCQLLSLQPTPHGGGGLQLLSICCHWQPAPALQRTATAH
jgi:hypothetical protein